jgi:predicted glycoside hydrolase/deacetylase ChbG (UPF0249 family)
MSTERALIVNADDFGMSRGVNRGVAEAHERGIVTSASLMVRWPAAAEAAAWAKRHPGLSLGLHFDLGEWVLTEGEWRALYEVVPQEDAEAVAAELERQLDTFRELTGRAPTHVDSHQHVHRGTPVQGIARRVAGELGVPLRSFSAVRYEGGFYGSTVEGEALHANLTREHLLALVESAPGGVTEVVCHPGRDADCASAYRAERDRETDVLADPTLRAEVSRLGMLLRSYHAVEAPRCVGGACATS